MSLVELGDNPAALWLVGAVLLGIAELILPGVFLVFLAVAAALTAGMAFMLPDMPLVAQLLAFGGWSVVAVLAGRRLYAKLPVPTSDPMLNDRASRMAGEVGQVSQALEHGRGRVRVGDSEWPAAGPTLATGTAVRIVAVEGGVVRVEPLAD